ncbi:vasodilator-stimulated phosphoprotein-like [Rattus norvegicus]|uniref:vasodilator-stimulated phosphoprotein-like n=1 Tax=Rattus norvegicus TaxID=10116 RepID=UPI00191756A4|nr:vasodilator-stimulated phosphoprotein-like [Rattus norvegicus]
MATDPQHPPSRRAGGRAGRRPQGRDSAERRTASCSGGWPPADWGGWTPSPPLPPRPPPPCPRPRPQISAGAAGLRGASGTDLGAEFVHHFSFKDLEPSYIAVDGGADES